MNRNLLFKLGRFFILFGLFVSVSSASFAQNFSYSLGALSVDITVLNPCLANNGAIRFTVNSTDAGQDASLVILGPVTLFPAQTIVSGGTYLFNPSGTLPAGAYSWLLGDGTNTIGSITDPFLYPILTLTDISAPPLSVTNDVETNNTSCLTPDGQVQASIVGGYQTIGTGSYSYTWSASNGTPGLPLSGTTDGTSPLDLATLLGVGGLRGGTYTITVADDFSVCTANQTFTITDPSPAIFNVTTATPLNICTGDNIVITMNDSEVGATYEILRNGVSLPIPITFPGLGTGVFVMTFPSSQFASGNSILVEGSNGFCSPILMNGTVNLVINPLPTILGVVVAPVCEGSISTNLTYTSTTGSPNQYSIDFDAAAEAQGFTDVVNVALPASPIVITVPGGAAAGTYNATLTVFNTVTGCINIPQAISVVIDPSPTITLGPNPAVCIGSVTANLTYSATTGSPSQYSIDFDVAAEAQGFTDVVNVALPASPIAITVPGGAIAGTYNGTLTVLNTVTGCSSIAQPISVTINPTPTITLGLNPAVCIGSPTANLSYSATTGSPDQYSMDFDAAAEAQGFVDVVSAALPATPISIVVPGAAVVGTYNATITVSNSVSSCVSAPQAISVTINPTPTITLGPDPAVCFGSVTANLSYSATTGSPSQYSIDFDAAAEAQGFTDVVNVALPASPIVITVPGGAVAGIYNGTLTLLNTVTGCISTPQAVSITIDTAPTITLGPNPSVCIGSPTADVGYSATTGSPDQYSIDFDAAAEAQGFTDVLNAALPATPVSIVVPGAAIAGTYNAAMTVLNSLTGCVSAINAISVTIEPAPTIALGVNPSVCSGTTTADLGYGAITGSPDQYSIDFDAAAEAQGFVDLVNVALPATPISIIVPGAAIAAPYNGMLTVLNTVTGCISIPQAISVTIDPTPTITLGPNPTVCIGSPTANLSYSATTGSPNQYSIDFDATAEAQGFTDVVNVALPGSPIAITVPGGAVAGTYNGTLTILNTVTGCSSSTQPISVTIEPTPTIALGANPSVCSGTTTADLSYGAITGSPDQYSIDFDAAAEAQGFVDVVSAALSATPISIVVPGAAAVGTYNATITVINSVSGCASVPQAISVTISQNALINLVVGVTIDPICSGDISEVTVSNSEVGVSYQLRNNADDSPVGAPVAGNGATINLSSGVLLATQTFNVLATAAGCPPVELTNTATINVISVIDAGLAVTAAVNPLCAGSGTNIQIANSENGVLYQLRDDADDSLIGAAVAGDGGTIDLPTGPLAVTTIFNVLASNGPCSVELIDIETVDVGPAPDPSLAVAVTIDPLCVGGTSEVTVALSQVGVDYLLRNDADDSPVGGFVSGTGATISLSTGVLNSTTIFNVLAGSIGCPLVELTSLATVNVAGVVDASLLLVAAASPICEGTSTDIQIANSELGVTYQLRDDATDTPVGGPVAGTGLPAPIILPTGNLTASTTFNVIATNGVCSIELTDLETVSVDVAPDPTLVVGVTLDPLCIGGISEVTVALSQIGVSYQLRNDVDDSPIGGVVAGTGGTINLSTGVLIATTVFNVLATSGVCPIVELTTLATVNVAGSVDAGLTVTSSVNPICVGSSTLVQVQNSEIGVTYQLRDDLTDATIGAPVAGDGATIDLLTGNLLITTTFNVLASNGACSIELTDLETITVTPGPAIDLAVTPASALICPGTSTNIIVAASVIGVTYQLRNDADDSPIGVAVAGTGVDILLPTGNLAVDMTFNVLATEGICALQLTATATVTILPVGDPACSGSDCTNFSAILPTIVTQPTCLDQDGGEVSFTISRADGIPTTFRVILSINGMDQTKFTTGTVSFNDLNSGLYQYTVIDEGNGKSCGPVDFFLDLKTTVDILSKVVTSNVTCFGGSDGNVIMSASGSTTGEYWYKYVLNGVESGAQTFTPGAPLPGGLPADDTNFIVLVVDESFAFSCPDTVMVRIMHIFPIIDFTVASTDVTICNGSDGAIQVASIGGGDTGSGPLQIRLRKAVPFSTDPSGFIVLVDFEDVVAGFKDYTILSQGNYIVDVKDPNDCIQSKAIAVQAPGQVPLAFVGIEATDASCSNDGASGSIKVTINTAGMYQVALSQDQVNIPADTEFVDYDSPSLPNITFDNLMSGVYYLYLKSSTTTCPTRTDAIALGGVQAINNFDVLSSCDNVNLTMNNITGQRDVPFVIRVFSNADRLVKIDSLTAPSIPLSNAVSFIYVAPLEHSFLTIPGTYRFVMVQDQTTGAGTCTMVSDTVVYDIRQALGIVVGEVKPSFPNPKRTGSIEIENIVGGTRFLSGANELFYEVSLYTADDNILIFDWEAVKLNPQNKFSKLYDYLSAGVYRIMLRDFSGCVISLDVEIELDPSIFVPNIFTPNNDNVNDEFEVLNLPLNSANRLIISNRWGNEVFTSKDYRDGTFWDAKDTADGIYFYRLQVDGGETFTGWVEVLRGSRP